MSWFPGHCCWIFMGNGVRPMAKKKRFCGYLLTLTTGIRRFFTEVCRWLAAGENRSFPFWGGRIYWDGQGHIHGVSLNIVLLREVLKSGGRFALSYSCAGLRCLDGKSGRKEATGRKTCGRGLAGFYCQIQRSDSSAHREQGADFKSLEAIVYPGKGAGYGAHRRLLL